VRRRLELRHQQVRLEDFPDPPALAPVHLKLRLFDAFGDE
jgi:hypothetical protein